MLGVRKAGSGAGRLNLQRVLISDFGYGSNARWLLAAGLSVTGIEISETDSAFGPCGLVDAR